MLNKLSPHTQKNNLAFGKTQVTTGSTTFNTRPITDPTEEKAIVSDLLDLSRDFVHDPESASNHFYKTLRIYVYMNRLLKDY